MEKEYQNSKYVFSIITVLRWVTMCDENETDDQESI